MEQEDTLEKIDAQLGSSILSNRYSGIRFGQPDYVPSFELIDEHAGYYEMVFILSDDGFGVEVFIPKVANGCRSVGDVQDVRRTSEGGNLHMRPAPTTTNQPPAEVVFLDCLFWSHE